MRVLRTESFEWKKIERRMPKSLQCSVEMGETIKLRLQLSQPMLDGTRI